MMTRYLMAAAVSALGIGMVLVYMGVLGVPLMIPGTVLIGIGIVMLFVACIAAMFSRDDVR